MTPTLADLEPKALWKHFDALAAIPRASTKEGAARQYVLAQSARLRLEAIQDAVGNIVIRKPARPGRESALMAVLQGDWLKADGTTLGADNGIGVAAALAVMEDDDIAHGPLEFLFTVNEETGLTGAAQFPGGLLKSKYFLNLDGEEEGTLCIGCSGGLYTTAHGKVTLRAAAPGAAWRIKVSGLTGGHSGVDIHQGRGNALRILGRVLQGLLVNLPIEIAELKGGSARNAIPREASAIVLLDATRDEELRSLIAAAEAEIQSDLGGFDPGVKITAEKSERPVQVLDALDAKRTVDLLASLHHGVLAMSPDLAGLVQTSTNLATVAIKGDEVKIGTSQRSAIQTSKLAAARMVATVCRLAGFEVEHAGDYPGWKPEPNSEVVRKLQAVHEEIFGEPARLIAMHAGLECGVIGEKYPGMQKVSFGPQIESPHSPNERVRISSVGSFWKYLRAVMERL